MAMTAIIGIRVLPSLKKQLMDEAKERGETLSDYLYEIIKLGRERIKKGNVKQETGTKP